jgi:uncharacterized protein (TIGR00369 family)
LSHRVRIDEDRARQAFEAALAEHTQAFGTFFLARFLGLEISYGDDCCIVEFETADFMFNPQGSLHGGVIVTAMDISMGHLLNHLQGPGMTLELKTQFVRAVRGGRVKAIGKAIRRGTGISFMESTFFDADGELAAFATSTWKSLARPVPGASEERR